MKFLVKFKKKKLKNYERMLKMFKIVLVFGLVLAVTKGHLDDGKANISELVRDRTKENIKLAQKRYDEILKNNTHILHNLAEDFSNVLSELKDKLWKSRYTILRRKECRIKLNDLYDIKNYCFSPNVPYCKPGMWCCIHEAGTRVGALLNKADKTRAKLKYIKEGFVKNIAKCRKTFDVLTLEYEECINNEISSGKEHVSKNQKIFDDQMDTAVNTSKEFISELENSVSVFAGRLHEIETCITKHLGKREDWWSSIFNTYS